MTNLDRISGSLDQTLGIDIGGGIMIDGVSSARNPFRPTPARRRYDAEVLKPLIGAPTTDSGDLGALRENALESFAGFYRTSDDEVEITDEILLTEQGSLRVRLYIPRNGYTGGLLWVHGGAFVLGFPEVDDDICRHLAITHARLVLSPDYRLAPEHHYPAAEQDCQSAFNFLREMILDNHPMAPIAIAGASAGGALALETALQAIASGATVERLLLIYPVVDSALKSESMARYESAPIFDGEHARLMWQRYLGDTNRNSWISPIEHPMLELLPLTLVVTTEHDPLRDEGLDLIRSLLSSGVSVQALHFAGSYHAFDRLAPMSKMAKELLATLDSFLSRPLLVQVDL